MYNTEIIIGMGMLIAFLLLLVCGLSSELTKQKNTVRRMCHRLDDTLKRSEQAVKDIYSK